MDKIKIKSGNQVIELNENEFATEISNKKTSKLSRYFPNQDQCRELLQLFSRNEPIQAELIAEEAGTRVYDFNPGEKQGMVQLLNFIWNSYSSTILNK